ncbi:hypothetical protein EXE43_17425 [Halorubrum sp. SS5]|nr:hypothetical protein EXE43_17425 [Halorubrum sp. SS5]
MKSGVIGIVEGEPRQVESYHRTVEQDGTPLTECIEVTQTHNNVGSGFTVQTGRAAVQSIVQEETVQITDQGEIAVVEEGQRQTKYTEFVFVPGEFVVVDSGSGVFLFDMLRDIVGLESVERAEFDLAEFLSEHSESTPWQVGFYGVGSEAEKGVVYGENVLSDAHIGNTLKTSNKNQVGVNHRRGEEKVKVSLTESGYIDVYQPSNYESTDFAEYVIDEIIHLNK